MTSPPLSVLFGPEMFEQRRGGITRYVVRLHTGFLERGIRSLVVAGCHSNEYAAHAERVVGVRTPPYFGRNRVNELAARAVWSTRRKAIYHKSYYDDARFFRKYGPLVVTLHDLIHARFPHLFDDADATVAQQRYWCQNADLVVANSNTTRADGIDLLGLPPDKVVTTHLGVDPAPQPALRLRPDERPYFLFVGARFPYKNWDGAVRALRRSASSTDAVLVCVGGGPFSRDERAFLEEQRMTPSVRWQDADDDTLDVLYRGALALVYVSDYEGFGLPPLEAMTRGTPVVASRAGAIPEVVGDAALLVPPRDDDALAQALDEVRDATRRAQLEAAGHARAAMFSWDATVDATLNAYRLLE